MSYSVTKFPELESFPVGKHGLRWHPIRSRLGIGAFGMNSYTAFELDPEGVREWAPGDTDLDSIRDEISAITGQADPGGPGA